MCRSPACRPRRASESPSANEYKKRARLTRAPRSFAEGAARSARRRRGDRSGGRRPPLAVCGACGAEKRMGGGAVLPESGGFEIGVKMHPVFLPSLGDFWPDFELWLSGNRQKPGTRPPDMMGRRRTIRECRECGGRTPKPTTSTRCGSCGGFLRVVSDD